MFATELTSGAMKQRSWNNDAMNVTQGVSLIIDLVKQILVKSHFKMYDMGKEIILFHKELIKCAQQTTTNWVHYIAYYGEKIQ